MKRKMLFIITLAGLVCLSFAYIQKVEAVNPVFFADFDGAGIPNNDVNDAGNWKPEHPAITWAIGDFPANGTKCLKMTAGGCGSSGYTPFPTVENWSDGIIQIDLGWFDDDSWGVMFRRGGPQEGYFAFFGWEETIDLALFDLGALGLNNGLCLNEVGVEEGPEPGSTIVDGMSLAAVRHEIAVFDKAGGTSYTGRILAQGPKIKVWYGLTENFPDDPLQEPNAADMAAVIEVEDAAYTSGAVGIWHESNDNGVIDNIYVYDASALAVTAQEKLATTWAGIKGQ